jgi:hypothetical protein
LRVEINHRYASGSKAAFFGCVFLIRTEVHSRGRGDDTLGSVGLRPHRTKGVVSSALATYLCAYRRSFVSPERFIHGAFFPERYDLFLIFLEYQLD